MILLCTTDRVGGEEEGREGDMLHGPNRKHAASDLALPGGLHESFARLAKTPVRMRKIAFHWLRAEPLANKDT